MKKRLSEVETSLTALFLRLHSQGLTGLDLKNKAIAEIKAHGPGISDSKKKETLNKLYKAQTNVQVDFCVWSSIMCGENQRVIK